MQSPTEFANKKSVPRLERCSSDSIAANKMGKDSHIARAIGLWPRRIAYTTAALSTGYAAFKLSNSTAVGLLV